MAYIKQKNSNYIICDSSGVPIQGIAFELASHGSVMSGFHEVVDADLPQEIKNKLIFVVPE